MYTLISKFFGPEKSALLSNDKCEWLIAKWHQTNEFQERAVPPDCNAELTKALGEECNLFLLEYVWGFTQNEQCDKPLHNSLLLFILLTTTHCGC